MNLRLFSIALLISALPVSVKAASAVSLDKGDFIAAEKMSANGETVLSVKLSKSGKAKFRKLNRSAVGKSVHAEVAGVVTDFVLREPIKGESLKMGPLTEEDAQKVIAEINDK